MSAIPAQDANPSTRRYTALRIEPEGVWFRAQHARRLAPEGGAALEAFDRFCASAEPGIHAVWMEGEVVRSERRAASRLRDGMPVRHAVSPFADRPGPFRKPSPPNAYATVRVDGVATLLTNAAGDELLESCSAGVLAWDAGGWIVAPRDRPRVDSVAERALWESGVLRERGIRRDGELPLVLINAVAGVCTLDPQAVSQPPERALALLREVMRASVR